jgi:hypothetical protein
MWTEAAITKQLDTWMHRNGWDLISVEDGRRVLEEPERKPVLVANPVEDIARDWLFLQSEKRGNPYSIQSIATLVSELTRVSLRDIYSVRRNKDIVRARQIICYVARETTSASFPLIGRTLGWKDHSTVMHSCSKVESKPDYYEPELTVALNTIQERQIAA